MSRFVLQDYGWKEPDSYSTRYLAPEVRRVCRCLQAQKVLDLGCGNGSITRLLVGEGCRVWGCDSDRQGLEIAARRVPEARFQQVSLYEDPASLGETGFDLVVACEVIEHLFFPQALPSFARAVLKPQGYLLVSTPYHGYLKNLALALTNRWDRHHAALDDGGHVKFFSRASLSRLLQETGFEVISFAGAGRVPWLWKSMILLSRLR